MAKSSVIYVFKMHKRIIVMQKSALSAIFLLLTIVFELMPVIETKRFFYTNADPSHEIITAKFNQLYTQNVSESFDVTFVLNRTIIKEVRCDTLYTLFKTTKASYFCHLLLRSLSTFDLSLNTNLRIGSN